MKRRDRPTLTLHLGFSDKDAALALLHSLAQDGRVNVNIMKARITEHYAQLELELVGSWPRLFDVASLLQGSATHKDPDWRPTSRAS